MVTNVDGSLAEESGWKLAMSLSFLPLYFYMPHA